MGQILCRGLAFRARSWLWPVDSAATPPERGPKSMISGEVRGERGTLLTGVSTALNTWQLGKENGRLRDFFRIWDRSVDTLNSRTIS